MQSCTIEIRLKPRARNDRLTVGENGIIDIAVTSPPLEGRANAHLVRFLAECLDLPRSAISLVRGEHARSKVVAIDGLDSGAVIDRLRSYHNGR